MMKKALQFAIGLFIMSNGAFAQAWFGNDLNVPSYRFGNVGIGTPTPNNPLTVVSGGSALALFQNSGSTNSYITVANATVNMNLGVGSQTPHPYIWSNTNNFFIGNDGTPTLFVQGMNNGNVGIGTSTPSSPLTVVSGGNSLALFQGNTAANTVITVANTAGGMNLGVGAQTPHPYIWSNTNSFFIGSDGNPTMYFNGMNNGSVGIGTTNTGSFKLAVEGKIAARGVKVTLGTFADYVFDPTYQLRPLNKLEQYINQNKHLPGIPSAEEVKKEGGVELGDMNVKLLEKIEELTLYVIGLKKENEQMKKEIAELKQKK